MFNRLASLLLGLVVAAVGVLIGLEAVMVLRGDAPMLLPLSGWYRQLRELTFGDGVVLAVAIGLAVLGLVLLIVQLRPWRPVRVPVTVDEDWYVQRRGAERGVVQAVDGVYGVTQAKVRVGKRWRCRVWAAGDAGSRSEVTAVVTDELERMSAPDDHRIRVRMSRPRRVT